VKIAKVVKTEPDYVEPKSLSESIYDAQQEALKSPGLTKNVNDKEPSE
jgi:hypothetical protein